MASDRLGPRRQALLEAWGEHITTESSGPKFDFSSTNRTSKTRTKTDVFVEKRDQESFEALWSRDVIADSVFSSAFVLNEYDENTEELAKTVEDVRQSSKYNEIWERNFAMKTAVWELYGRLHPSTAPILNSESSRGLEFMGFSRPTTHPQAVKQWDEFKRTYEAVVGHATAGTGHEVTLHHEIGEFLWFVAKTDEDDLEQILLQEQDTYRPITGWRDEKPLQNDIQITGLTRHIEGYITAKEQGGFERDGPDDLWNKGHFESWKDSYLQHIEDVVKPRYDLTSLSPSDIEPLLDDLTESTTLGTPVPSYMLGGQSGGILWNEFKKTSLKNTKETAAVLSYLFNMEEDISIRLDRFSKFCRNIDTSGGPLLSLATILLSFVYPDEYVFYKYSLMNDFFQKFAGYDVRQRFNTNQYYKLNSACKNQILKALGYSLEDATMLDVYTLFYEWDRHYNKK